MASATVVKWQYNEVVNNCTKMTSASKELLASYNNLKSALANLDSWQGTDATEFKNAMSQTILPALETESKFMASVAATLKKQAETAKEQEELRAKNSNLKDSLSAIKNRIGN